MNLVKNCESCRYRSYIERAHAPKPVLICNNIWMMSYGDEKTEQDIFDCIGCVAWEEDTCLVSPVGEVIENTEAIRNVSEFFGMDTEYWIDRMNDPVTVSDLFTVLNKIGKS